MLAQTIKTCKKIPFLTEPIYRNSINLILATVINSIIGFIFWLVAARVYAPTDVGIASTLISAMSLIAIFAYLGFNVSLIRFLPHTPNAEKLFNTATSICSLLTVTFCLLFIVWTSGGLKDLKILCSEGTFSVLFIFFSVAWVISNLQNSVFIAKRASRFVLVKETTFGLSKLFFLIPLTLIGSFGIFSAWGIGTVIALVVGLIFVKGLIPNYKPYFCVEKNMLKDVFTFSFFNYIAWVFNYLPAFLLPIIITYMADPTSTAYFYICWMIANVLFIVPLQTSQSLFAEGSNNINKLRESIKKSLIIVCLLLTPGILGLIITGKYILMIFGSEYSTNGSDLLNILAISAFFYAINIIFISINKVRQENRVVVIISGIIGCIALFGSYLLLPTSGLIGVGQSWLIANLIPALAILIMHSRDMIEVFKEPIKN